MISIDGAKKSKRGRPSVDSEAVNVRIERELLERIDDWRRYESDLPSRPEAIRRLLDAGISVPPSADALISALNGYSLLDAPSAASAADHLKRLLDAHYGRRKER
ncbi:hypothetical protein CHELA1G11_12433 [Hyphomicrobiales bacterium]|nr:hypothetical protein CHELA1G2_11874 [Hyphomicrobiales bacterium]CAH1664801.1 hypothetical protein CHELA1G11_12433 [Hyphomicrobiales bacterium]